MVILRPVRWLLLGEAWLRAAEPIPERHRYNGRKLLSRWGREWFRRTAREGGVLPDGTIKNYKVKEVQAETVSEETRFR